jgi:hypothetical protein
VQKSKKYGNINNPSFDHLKEHTKKVELGHHCILSKFKRLKIQSICQQKQSFWDCFHAPNFFYLKSILRASERKINLKSSYFSIKFQSIFDSKKLILGLLLPHKRSLSNMIGLEF